jgi:hypothetical protein
MGEEESKHERMVEVDIISLGASQNTDLGLEELLESEGGLSVGGHGGRYLWKLREAERSTGEPFLAPLRQKGD